MGHSPHVGVAERMERWSNTTGGASVSSGRATSIECKATPAEVAVEIDVHGRWNAIGLSR
jgi:hypothetical protein